MLHQMTRRLICIFAIGCANPCFAAAGSANDSLFHKLNLVLANKEFYVALKEARIKKIETQLRTTKIPVMQFSSLKKLYDEYKSFRYDSAYAFSKRLEHVASLLKDPQKLITAKMSISFTLLSAGMFKEAIEKLDQIDTNALAPADRIDYYFLKSRCYFDWGDFNHNSDYNRIYYPKALAYMDSAIELTHPGTYYYLSLLGLKNMRIQNYKASENNYVALLKLPGLTASQFAVSASSLSYVYSMEGKQEKADSLLAAAAIADLQSATKETVAIYELANRLYRKGDGNNAFNYINEAMEEAIFYGARHRQVAISSIMPIIQAQRIETMETQRRSLFIYAAIITLLILFVIGFAVIIFIQLKKLSIAGDVVKKANLSLQASNQTLEQVNHNLSTANKIKNEYITFYFNMNSVYLEKLEKIQKSLEKKLINQRFEDALYAVRNLHLQEERIQLFNTFDKVFLKLFPDFITKFNQLFNASEAPCIPEGQLLSTEHRIFALIRMGISDNDRIAKLLGYSVNTIYAYKNRLRSRSYVPNDEFVHCIMQIEAQ